MNLPDLLRETDRLGMTFTVGPGGKLRWQTREKPSADLLRSLAAHKAEVLAFIRLEEEVARRAGVRRFELGFAARPVRALGRAGLHHAL